MSERATLAGAGAAHLALIAALSLAWARMDKPTLPPPDAVAVDLVDIADTPTRTAEARPATAPPTPRVQPEPKVAPPPPAPEPEPPAPAPRAKAPISAPPEAKPEPVPDPVAERSAPKPKPHKIKLAKAEKPAPNPDQIAQTLDKLLAKPAARPGPKRANPTQLASLLDKAIARAPAHSAAKPGPAQTAQPANAELSPAARATLVQAIAGQIYPCWNVPAGSEEMTVDLHIQLAKDGSLAAPPEVRATAGGPNAAVQRVFAESAKRAVARCTPLKLPANLYAQWHDLDPMHFDPRNVK